MKRILEELEPKFDTEPEAEEEEPIQETVDNLSSLNTIDICIIRAAPLV